MLIPSNPDHEWSTKNEYDLEVIRLAYCDTHNKWEIFIGTRQLLLPDGFKIEKVEKKNEDKD